MQTAFELLAFHADRRANTACVVDGVFLRNHVEIAHRRRQSHGHRRVQKVVNVLLFDFAGTHNRLLDTVIRTDMRSGNTGRNGFDGCIGGFFSFFHGRADTVDGLIDIDDTALLNTFALALSEPLDLKSARTDRRRDHTHNL